MIDLCLLVLWRRARKERQKFGQIQQLGVGGFYNNCQTYFVCDVFHNYSHSGYFAQWFKSSTLIFEFEWNKQKYHSLTFNNNIDKCVAKLGFLTLKLPSIKHLLFSRIFENFTKFPIFHWKTITDSDTFDLGWLVFFFISCSGLNKSTFCYFLGLKHKNMKSTVVSQTDILWQQKMSEKQKGKLNLSAWPRKCQSI